MITVDASDAGLRLSTLLAAVERGETVRICRHGKPVADLRPAAEEVDRLRPHPLLSQVEFRADPAEPLTDDEWPIELR